MGNKTLLRFNNLTDDAIKQTKATLKKYTEGIENLIQETGENIFKDEILHEKLYSALGEIKANIEFYKSVDKEISQLKSSLEESKLTKEELIERLAINALTVRLQQDALYELQARHQTCRECMVKDSSRPLDEKIKILKAFSEASWLKPGEIAAEARARVASQGAIGKSKGEKGQMDENAKKWVKEKWEEWQKKPSQYQSALSFSIAMATELGNRKSEGKKVSAISSGAIRNWCTVWAEEKHK